jgi:AhpC/TSA family
MTLVNEEILTRMTTQTGLNLAQLSNQKPIMLVFLRHFGCQFCRQGMDELANKRKELAEGGTEIVLVHMAENDVADSYFQKFNLEGIQHISDPNCRYYAAFGLVKGSFTQLFGLQTWIKGFKNANKYGNEMGKHLGDSFQMPGAFMLFKGEVRDQHIHKSVADKPDYDRLLRCCTIG